MTVNRESRKGTPTWNGVEVGGEDLLVGPWATAGFGICPLGILQGSIMLFSIFLFRQPWFSIPSWNCWQMLSGCFSLRVTCRGMTLCAWYMDLGKVVNASFGYTEAVMSKQKAAQSKQDGDISNDLGNGFRGQWFPFKGQESSVGILRHLALLLRFPLGWWGSNYLQELSIGRLLSYASASSRLGYCNMLCASFLLTAEDVVFSHPQVFCFQFHL